MDISKKKCKTITKKTEALTESQIDDLIEQIPLWGMKNEQLYKWFEFKDFKEAMKFVNKVSEAAEKENHHPSIKINYNIVELTIWTHTVNGLSENDFILAAKIDEIKK